jgi:hypothetical protein
MIRFKLNCDYEHEFEGWFRNNEDFDAQAERGLITCPVCSSPKVEKALMTPSVATSRAKEKVALGMGEAQRLVLEQMRELSRKMRENADYVGDKFAEEARKIHFGEADPRGIYGEASREEVTSLVEEGVEIMPLPVFPEDRN